MIGESIRISRILAVPALACIVLIGLARPPVASAQWGACLDDPKVWLNTGTAVAMSSSVSAPRSRLTHVTFTVHVPRSTYATRVVRTAGVDSTFETVNVVADSQNGYRADFSATTYGGTSYPFTLTMHVAGAGSAWTTYTGITGAGV